MLGRGRDFIVVFKFDSELRGGCMACVSLRLIDLEFEWGELCGFLIHFTFKFVLMLNIDLCDV